jgi:hypothetical protein
LAEEAGIPADAIRIGPGGAGSTVRGFVINRFNGSGIRLLRGADDCTIEGNRVGTDTTGTQPLGTPSIFHIGRNVDGWCYSGQYGVEACWRSIQSSIFPSAGVRVGSHENVIQDNIIAGNYRTLAPDFLTFGGVNLLLDPFTRRNVVRRNRIGVGADGEIVFSLRDPALAGEVTSYHVGLLLHGSEHTIGGPGGDGNHIAGHDIGVLALATAGNRIVGNTFGDVANDAVLRDVALWLVGPESDLYDVTASEGRGLLENNRVVTHAFALDVEAEWDVIGNELHGQIGGRSEPVSGGADPLFTSDVAVWVSGAAHLEDNEITAPGWTVRARGTGATLVGNIIGKAEEDGAAEGVVPWGGIRVYETDDPEDEAPLEEAAVLLSRNEIRARSIGIDLHAGASYELDGVTPNDFTDLDEGPNGLLNYPVIQQAVGSGGALLLSGFIEGAFGATYTVEVFGNTACARPYGSALAYGPGEAYLGTATVETSATDVGQHPFALTAEGLAPEHRYVTLTASRLDLGVTSEFSRCVRLADPAAAASAEVDPGQTGPVLDAVDVRIALDAPSGKTAASRHDGGTVYVTRYDAAPDTSVFAEMAATAPDSTLLLPETVAARYWLLAETGLAAVAEGETPARFQVCLAPAGTTATGDERRAVLVHRSEATFGQWYPLDTTLEEYDGAAYLCAGGLSGLGEFSLGSGSAAALAAPLLTAPDQGATDVDMGAALSWQAVPEAATYDLQVAADPGFRALLTDTTGLVATTATPDSLARSTLHYWRVRGVTASGEAGPWSSAFRFTTGDTGVSVENDAEVPDAFVLEANYPNPFNPQTTIGYVLAEAGAVRLVVYDVLGRQVAVLVDGVRPAGRHEVTFEAANLPTGVYLYRIDAGTFIQTRRMLLVK